MLDRCCSFNGAIIIICKFDKLLILRYIPVQGVDFKVGQMIYALQRVLLIKFMPNEPILSEIYEKYMKIVKSANLLRFLNRLAVSTSLAYFGQNYRTLTD